MSSSQLQKPIPSRNQRLYLTADSDIEARIERVLSDAMQQAGDSTDDALARPYPQVLAIDCDYAALRQLSDLLQTELSHSELDRVACHVGTPSPNPAASELMQAHKLSKLINKLDGDWIRETIQDRRLVTYYQPIVQTDDPSQVFGYECLTRGKGAQDEIIAPAILFSRAKRAGMLNDLDLAAFLTALRSINSLQSSDRFLLNVCPAVACTSPRDLHHMLSATVSSVNLNQIVIEVTESERIEDDAALMNVLAEFRSAGVRLALDDVGSGYSSLTLLAELRPELIKIDMTLIRGASKDPYRACIVRKLFELAKDLGIKTVAEGIETVDDWKWSLDNGADYAQGFLFAHPLPAPCIPIRDRKALDAECQKGGLL